MLVETSSQTTYLNNESTYPLLSVLGTPQQLVLTNKDNADNNDTGSQLQEKTLNKKDWWLLPGTGFDVEGQINKLVRDLKKSKPKNALAEFSDYTAEDIRHFIVEYPLQRLVFPIFLEIKMKNEDLRLVAPRYLDQLYADLVSPQERGGIVKKKILEIEKYLINSPTGAMAVMISPPGESGLADGKGGTIKHTDNQTYIFKKENSSKVSAYTIRTDMDLDQSEDLLKRMGSLRQKLTSLHSEEDRISQIMNSTLYFNDRTFEDVVDAMEVARKSKFAYKEKSFAEIRTDLRIGNQLLEQNGDVQKYAEPYIEKFQCYVWAKINALSTDVEISAAISDIEKELGKTILDILIALKTGRVDLDQKEPLSTAKYTSWLGTLQSYGGCNGGGLDDLIPLLSGKNNKPWEYKPGLCRVCGSNSEVGPCSVCKQCEQRLEQKEAANKLLLLFYSSSPARKVLKQDQIEVVRTTQMKGVKTAA